jgi:hypothetical protein
MPAKVRKLRQLEEENARLPRLGAALSLDKEMLQEVIRKKALRPAQVRATAKNTPRNRSVQDSSRRVADQQLNRERPIETFIGPAGLHTKNFGGATFWGFRTPGPASRHPYSGW